MTKVNEKTVELVAGILATAHCIEAAASDLGITHHAGQDKYGVGVEFLIGGEWVRAEDHEGFGGIEAARLYDCDGERGEACRTFQDVLAEGDRWRGLMERAAIENQADAEG